VQAKQPTATTAPPPVSVQTCQFVLASDLFAGLPECHWALSASGNITFGDANRTLVTAGRILEAVTGAVPKRQFKSLQGRITKLPEGDKTYVDLEN
jgi:hypothetical protein